MIIYIYQLIDPRDNAIFYFGQTKTPDVRYAFHVSTAFRSRRNNGYYTPTQLRIQQIINDGLFPVMEVIEETYTPHDAILRERYWLIIAHKQKMPLTNGHMIHIKGVQYWELPIDMYVNCAWKVCTKRIQKGVVLSGDEFTSS